LGVVELAIALAIALRPLSAAVAVVGSGAAVAMFLKTLSFLVSTPGWEPSLGGFPALSVAPGQFLLRMSSSLAPHSGRWERRCKGLSAGVSRLLRRRSDA
jgi:uncharacterized membrane protein YkgB